MYLLLIFLSILLPVVIWACFRLLLDRTYKKSIRVVREAYKRVVIRHLLSISEVNMFGSRLIAMDKNLRKLVLIDHRNGITWEKCVDISKIIFCQVSRYQQKTSGSVQKVTLELTLADNHGTIDFPFFDEEVDDMRDFSYRLKKAQSWKRKIQLQLSITHLNKAN